MLRTVEQGCRKIPERVIDGTTDGLAASPIVRERVERARDLFSRWGDALKSDPYISGLLRSLEMKVAATQEVMRSVGITELCRRCDEDEGGSCCGAGIENRYSVALLLMNLLMGQTLPERRNDVKSCYFLGHTGCTLKARHVICVNYLCSRIERQLTREGRMALQNASGEELDTAFILHEAIVRFMKRT